MSEIVSSLWPFKREVELGSFRVRVGKQIGEGAFSYVYAAHDARTGEKFALKKMILQEKRQLDVVPFYSDLEPFPASCGHCSRYDACAGGAMGDGSASEFPAPEPATASRLGRLAAGRLARYQGAHAALPAARGRPPPPLHAHAHATQRTLARTHTTSARTHK